MAKRIIFFLYILFSFSINSKAQQNLKIKKEDNRFLFFQIGLKNDTIFKNRNDLFYIKLPDSLNNNLIIALENGKLSKTNKTNTFQLNYIHGMKYSHTMKDTIFETLVEGVSLDSKIITISVYNTITSKAILSNKFIVK